MGELRVCTFKPLPLSSLLPLLSFPLNLDLPSKLGDLAPSQSFRALRTRPAYLHPPRLAGSFGRQLPAALSPSALCCYSPLPLLCPLYIPQKGEAQQKNTNEWLGISSVRLHSKRLGAMKFVCVCVCVHMPCCPCVLGLKKRSSARLPFPR